MLLGDFGNIKKAKKKPLPRIALLRYCLQKNITLDQKLEKEKNF